MRARGPHARAGATAGTPRPAPTTLAARKSRILTHGTPSVTHGIADAIVTKSENIFFLTDPAGAVPLAEGHGLGLYYHDCRFLRGYELTIAGAAPTVLAAIHDRGDAATFELTNPDLHLGRVLVPRESLSVRWTRTLDPAAPALHETLVFRTYRRDRGTLPIALAFDARFEDVFEVRGLFRQMLGTVRRPRWSGRTLSFIYDGKDHIRRIVRITFSGAPVRHRGSGAEFHIPLRPGHDATLGVEITLEERKQPRPRAPSAARHDAHVRTLGRGPRTSFTSDDPFLDAAIHRSLSDLDMLRSRLDGEEFFAAGVPWFATLFGRDAALTALQTLAWDPAIAAQTARVLAHYQARETSDWRDEQPGKILHSVRVGEMARLGLIPHTPYYGSVDATPLFLILVARHAQWTGDLELFRMLREHVDLALTWLDGPADLDGDGYIEYACTSTHGLINQGWKDSGDAIIDARGHIATPPIALVEVQAYAYLARTLIAGLFERAGDTARARALRETARRLRARFERDYWLESIGCYALALESRKRTLDVVTSNAGHALWGRIAAPRRARRVAERLMQEDAYSGWGIRTLVTTARAYNPVGYHLGTVWPHDNAIIGAGFRAYGLDAPARRVFAGLVAAASQFDANRLPEVFAGFSRHDYDTPVHYPVACHPQAWAAGAIPYLLVELLGLEPDAFAGRLRVVHPTLPDGVSRLELRDVAVGRARVGLRFTREAARRPRVDVIAIDGPLTVDVET